MQSRKKTTIQNQGDRRIGVTMVPAIGQAKGIASPLPTRFDSQEALDTAPAALRAAAAQVDYTSREAQRRLLDQIMQEDKKILAALAK